MLRSPAAAPIDVCCVLAFVAIGRASHDHGESAAGLASTAWPFLTGLAVGWLASRAWRRPAAITPAGLGAWLGTVAIGMILRVVAGQGTAPAFIAVALAFLALFLLGWRAAVTAWSRSRPTIPPPDPRLPARPASSARPPPVSSISDSTSSRPPGQDPLSWKNFDHTCEKYSTIRDLVFTDGPEPVAKSDRKPRSASGPARTHRGLVGRHEALLA
jgi:hypothetical protein